MNSFNAPEDGHTRAHAHAHTHIHIHTLLKPELCMTYIPTVGLRLICRHNFGNNRK